MRLRFTLRDWFWLVIVIALSAGWWLDHRRMADIADADRRFEALRVRSFETPQVF